MRSLRALTGLLLGLVLVPAAVLGWLGFRWADAQEALLVAGARADLDAAAREARARLPDVAHGVEETQRAALAPHVRDLEARLPRDGVAAGMAAWRDALPAALDVVELELLDTGGRRLWPAPWPPEARGASGPDRMVERLLEDLRREAEGAWYGRGDATAAIAVWRDAAPRFAAAGLRRLAEAEAALLAVRAGVAPASGGRAPLEGPEVAGPAARPLLLLALESGDADALWRAARDGVLDAVPLTDGERTRARGLAARAATGDPAAGADGPRRVLGRAAEGHVDAATGLPSPRPLAWARFALPGGATLRVGLDPGPPWRETARRLAATLAGPEIALQGAAGPPPPDPRPAVGPDAVRDHVLAVDGPFGAPGHLLLSNPRGQAALAGRGRRRALTLVGVASLLAVMAVGLLLVRRAVARERAARRLRDAFVANVTHEIRTPLTSVCLHAEMLAEEDPPPARRRALARTLRAEGARLAALVEDLLDLAALESGSRRIECSPVDLARAAEAAVDPWRVLAERDGVALAIEVPPGEVPALADPAALERILANLLGNAWKHGRPSRDGAPGRLRVRVLEVGGRPAVEVRDDGPGLEPSERALVFERFRRGRAAGGRVGLGLGLALARDLARAMDASLDLVDDAEETVFRLVLAPVPEVEA